MLNPLFPRCEGDLTPGVGGCGVTSHGGVGVGSLHTGGWLWGDLTPHTQPPQVRVLKDVMEVRSEVFVVGPAGSGKSTLWRALARGGNSYSYAPDGSGDLLNLRLQRSDS